MAEGSSDVFTPQQRSAVMRRVKGKDTAPELKVRRLLTRLGARYRLHRADLPGKPDIVMPGRRLVIFVHGCFWHGHDCARGARTPKANRAYWQAKIGANRARDLAHHAALEAAGWRVAVLWECALKDETALEGALAELLALPAPKSGDTAVRFASDPPKAWPPEARPLETRVALPHGPAGEKS